MSIERTYTSTGAANPCGDDVYVLPVSTGQHRFWYLDQLQPGNPAYNIAIRFWLRGPLQVATLERALNEIVRRHEALRTVFATVDGVPWQVIAPCLTLPLKRDDLRGEPGDIRVERAEIIATEEAHWRFDLAQGPLFRARLVCLGDEEHILILTVHHVIADGWSMGIVTQEISALYGAYCRGLDSPLPDLSLQYGDFAIWQEQWLKTANFASQISYWTRQLADLPRLEIPTDRPRPPLQTFSGAIESVLLPKTVTDGLVNLSHQNGVTLFVSMLAGLQVLLQRVSGQSDIFVGSLLAGRSRVELEPLIGLFINSVVLRTDLSGDPPFLELLPRVRDTVLEAFANQDVPWEQVVQALRPKRDPSRHPVYQINFIFQRAFVRPFEAADVTLTAIPALSPGAIYDLNFFMVERSEGWRASCEYNTDLYDASTIRRLLQHFQSILGGIAEGPARRISEFPLSTSPSPKLESCAVQIPQSIVMSGQVHWIQSTGARPPWIVVTDQPDQYRELARHLGPDQPVLGLTFPEWKTSSQHFTMKDAVAIVMASLRAVVPHGPYYLGGTTASGLLAYEMARQLHEQGEDVALLVMLNTTCPGLHERAANSPRLVESVANLRRGVHSLLKRWREGSRNGVALHSEHSAAEQSEHLGASPLTDPDANAPAPTFVPVVLFRSTDIGGGESCWAPLCRYGLTEFDLPGVSEDLFREPVVKQLATQLTECLRRTAAPDRAVQR